MSTENIITDNKFCCKICNKVYTNHSGMWKHNTKHHKNIINSPNNNNNQNITNNQSVLNTDIKTDDCKVKKKKGFFVKMQN